MYEKETFSAIIKRCLARINNVYDKRQGAIIYDALAPASAELAQIYIEYEHILKITFAVTSYGDWLTLLCAQMGVVREEALPSLRLGLFYTGYGESKQPLDVPIGSRYSLELLNFYAEERIEKGVYRMRCETPGIEGNRHSGRLIPIDNVNELTYAEITETLIPGEDEEDDETLFERYAIAVNTKPYGGNIDDYKRKVRAIPGVGDCKIYPIWQGGGTVGVSIIASDWDAPSAELVAGVQEILDPEPYRQVGLGIAPIGHLVTVWGVNKVLIDVNINIALKNTFTVGMVEEPIREMIDEYLQSLAKTWAKGAGLDKFKSIVVRRALIESKMIDVDGVLDVFEITLNGENANIALMGDDFPALGELTIASV